jgi:hypothetical protein
VITLTNAVDLSVFVLYFASVIALGLWVGRRRPVTESEYFLAGRSIPWYAVGASFIASNISTEHFIGMVGAAYVYGICVANWEWLNIWAFSVLMRYVPLLAPFTSRATFVWFMCILAMVIVSLATARPPADKVSDQTTINWRKLNIFRDLGRPWFKNVVLWWALFLVGTAGVMFAFSKWSGLFAGR